MKPARAIRFSMLVAALGLAAAFAPPALASEGTPAIAVHLDAPDTVTAGQGARFVVVVQNVGTAPLTGNLTVADTFPAEMEVPDSHFGSCVTQARTDTCTGSVEGLLPGGELYVLIYTPVESSATGSFIDSLEVRGGGTPQDITVQQRLTVGPPQPFAFKDFTPSLLDATGVPAVQAGSDPAEIDTRVAFPTFAKGLFGFLAETPAVEQFKDITAHLPAGLIGNPTSLPHCTAAQLGVLAGSHGEIPACPAESQVGVVRLANSDLVPLFNMVPVPGSPASFAFAYQGLQTVLIARIRPADDGIDIVTRDAPSSVPISGAEVTFWGVPGDPSHDPLRDFCLDGYQGNTTGEGHGPNGSCPLPIPSRVAFLRLPTSCTGPLAWSADATSYQHPDPAEAVHATVTSPAMTGCGQVPFEPVLALAPSVRVPSSPTGLEVNLSLPQNAGPDGIAEGDLRSATVTLPAGVSIDPSSANGLQACTDAQLRLGVDGAASCPDASKIGEVTLTTPVLDHPLTGAVFVRTQNSSDPASGELFRIAIEIRSDADGIDIKLPGRIRVDAVTGRLTTVFDELPQLPFSLMHLRFQGGPNAPLSTPETCGAATTHSVLSSWSGKTVSSDSALTVSADGNGAPCAAPGFAPSLVAGTSNPQAGAFSPFTMSLTRGDGEQRLSGVQVTTPVGLAGIVKGVPECPEAEANSGTCDASTKVGTMNVGAGAGSNPFFIPGNVYFTGPYRGAPFGLSIVTRAIAGPFDLGTVVVRAAISIDPHTAQLTVTSDPLPTILKGVPLNIRRVDVSIDRQGFTFNPTGCSEQAVTANLSSTQGAVAHASSRFEAANCAVLGFTPRFSASTGASYSKANGVGLDTKLVLPAGGSNAHVVRVTVPRQLPARNTTLNKACLARVFEANPAACPAGSLVGAATASTPVLPVALTGPAYLVSHGGAAFPDLVVVLQGDGVRFDLVGNTNISKSSVTTSTFRSAPDVPVSSFELKLPAGPHSIFTAFLPKAAGHSLCGQKLTLPVSMTAYNGRVFTQNTKIAPSGCKTANKKAKKARHTHR